MQQLAQRGVASVGCGCAFVQRAFGRIANAADTVSSRPVGRTGSGSHSAVTVISLRVSVPVLSLQMVVVEPSVSTADSAG